MPEISFNGLLAAAVSAATATGATADAPLALAGDVTQWR
jgi:hypothetical protein